MPHDFDKFEMHEGTDHSLFSRVVVQALVQNGKLDIGTIDHVDAVSVEEEETDLSTLDPNIGSATLVRPRVKVVEVFQALVRDAFRRHAIPTKGGMDIGSGASGYMVANLLPEQAKPTWLQMELSPGAAQMNREANPGQQVITGSYLRLQQQGVTNMLDVVTGLSSLDATGHIDRAVEEIRQALKVGGYLMHMQDTRPGITIAHQQLRQQGAASPYQVVYMNDPDAQPNAGLIYRQGDASVDVLELFRRRLGRALADNGGFDVVENTWMTAIGPGTTPGMNKHSELGVMVGLEADGTNIDSASGVITVARRAR